MASADQIKEAIGCLSTVFPQYVAKELASIVDEITASVQGFTDPLAAIGDLNINTLLDDVATLSEGDVYGNLGSAAAGLMDQYAMRELRDMNDAMVRQEGQSFSRFVSKAKNISAIVVNGAASMMSIYSDMPYAIAQKMCETIIGLGELKQRNLNCLRKHIIQVVNSTVVLVNNMATFVDTTFDDLTEVLRLLGDADLELIKSQRVSGSTVVFDASAFQRARDAVEAVRQLLTPDHDGTSILDLAYITSSGSVAAAENSIENQKLVTLVIPALVTLIEAEVSAYAAHVNTINFYVDSLAQVIAEYRSVGSTSRVQEQRSRLIAEIRARLQDVDARINHALDDRLLSAASTEMLLWSSRIKAVLVMMDRVKSLALQEGSVEGPDKAFVLEQTFANLLVELAAISNDFTSQGVEDPVVLRSQVLSITKAVTRVIDSIETGSVSQNELVNLHTLMVSSATSQVSNIDASIAVASSQKVACEKLTSIELGTRQKLDQVFDAMRQLNLDRGEALLRAGKLVDFFSVDVDELSFIGAAANCLNSALNGIDDVQTRKQVSEIRDNMIAQRANQEIAAADSADQGRTRFIENAKETMASLQRNARTVEAIVTDLKSLLDQLGEKFSESASGFTALMSDIDNLQVQAGGRLAPSLEEFSEHPKAGVVVCEL